MRRWIRPLLAGLVLVAAGAYAAAHIRLIVPSNGNPLFWVSPTNVSIVVNSTGSDDITDGSHMTALRQAIGEWNKATGTSAQLVEDTNPTQQARTDFSSSAIHLILFDENNSSTYFPPLSGTVAITPIWFFTNGQISDADILFNGQDFQFTTSSEFGRFDIQDVGAHELGHLLGLDHSGWAGATMYPYVDPTVIEHRSLSKDDIGGMRDAYPFGTSGTISGHVERASDSSAVVGAYVVCRDDEGRSAGSILTDALGNFTLGGLDNDVYTVYATPLDEPVSIANLIAGHTVNTDFEPGFFGSTADLSSGGTVNLGTLQVSADVTLNLGRNSDTYPLRAIDGGTMPYTIRGTGLNVGSTLTASDPDLTVSAVVWSGSMVSFNLTVPAAEAPGHVDLQVTNVSGEVAVLPAAVEVTPVNPIVTTVTPSQGSSSGGDAVTITGGPFQAACRVVIGDQIYEDGAPGGCTVVDPNTITLTTLPTVGGTHDVVVVDATGIEGRKAGAYASVNVPTITTTFPGTGQAAGSTEVVLTGQDFLAGLTVRIDGVDQPGPTIEESGTVLRFDTVGGAAGGPYTLEVTNPGGGLANSVFAYVAQSDPVLGGVTPATGSAGGGDTVSVTGSNFTTQTQVWFGIDPNTGAGGAQSNDVTFVDAGTLTVVTPAFGGGTVSMMVQEGPTGQAGLLTNGFSFSAPAGGGGGGCWIRPVDQRTPPAFRDVLLGTWWLLALAALLALRSHRPALGVRRTLR